MINIPPKPVILSLDDPKRPENGNIRATPQFDQADQNFTLPPNICDNNSQVYFGNSITDVE